MTTETGIYIHVGYRKTATTWLQNVLFNNCKTINYIGKTEKNYPDWLMKWHYLDDYVFDTEKEHIKELFHSQLDSHRVNLLSSEAFTNTAVIFSQAHRIKDIVPNAKIIITLRDPIEMLKSHYKDDVEDGLCFLDLKEYFDWERTPFVLIKRKPHYLPDYFFNETIDIYEKLFDSENICILKYEDMINDSLNYFSRLENFLGVIFNNVEEYLKITLHKGMDEDKLLKKRSTSFHSFIKKYFPNLALKIKNGEIEADMKSYILDKETELKLKSYFQGKSLDYY